MKLGIVLNTSHPETAWNAIRLGNAALKESHVPSVFLMGSGVEIESIGNQPYDVPEALAKYVNGGGKLLACGTCLKSRNRDGVACPVSTMSQLLQLISDSDKVVSFG